MIVSSLAIDPPGAEALAGAFDLDAVGFAVSGRTLLHPLTTSFASGRITGLIGQNGSGKSTLVKLLARQQPSTEGTIRFGGQPMDRLGARDFARKVAYLPQQTPTAAGMKVRELVALGRYPWHGAWGRFTAVDARAVAEAMALADIEDFADRMVDELSGGERQRVWLAMLVAQEAGWLLLDEPTSALDVAHQLEVLSLVRDLSRTRGLGVVVVLHDVNMAARFCDEIVALRAGRMIARGAPDAIMTNECLETIYGVTMDVVAHAATGAKVAIAR